MNKENVPLVSFVFFIGEHSEGLMIREFFQNYNLLMLMGHVYFCTSEKTYLLFYSLDIFVFALLFFFIIIIIMFLR